jgi:tRNA G18 (ribose-2'-O)-methylase SpoU
LLILLLSLLLTLLGIQYADIIAKKNEYKTEWRRETMSSAMGSQKWLTLSQHDNTTDALIKLKQNGYRIV